MIAQGLSYGGYHAVYVPTDDDDSVKEYIRMRGDHKTALKKIKQQINALCLRHGHHYAQTKWTIAHWKWLKKPELSALYREVLNEYMISYEEQTVKIDRLDQRIEKLVAQEMYAEKVKNWDVFLESKRIQHYH